MKKTNLQKYEDSCERLVWDFFYKYWLSGKDKIQKDEIDYYWVADQVGGTLSVNDYFFNMDDIVQAMRLKPSREQFFAYQSYCIDQAMEKDGIRYNLKSWIALKSK